MSSIQLNSVRFNNEIIDSISKEHEAVISSVVFNDGGIAGGVRTYNDLAGRAKKLSELQEELKTTSNALGEIESQEQSKKKLAVALCIASAVLIAALAVTAVGAFLGTGALLATPPASLWGIATFGVCFMSIVGMKCASLGFAASVGFAVKTFQEKYPILDKKVLLEQKVAQEKDLIQQPTEEDKTTFANAVQKLKRAIDRVSSQSKKWEKVAGKNENKQLLTLRATYDELLRLRENIDTMFPQTIV